MLNNLFLKTSVTVLSLLLIIPMVFAQNIYQPVGGSGGIDYSKRVIITKGIGMPGGVGGRYGQIRAAIIIAQRNYLEVVKGAYLNSNTTVENGMMTGEIIQTRLEGLVRNFTPIDTAYMDDGSIEVTLEFDMSGQFLDEVLPKNMGTISSPPTYSEQPTKRGVYSGLIVDARGLGVRPALAPKIIDESGKEVYGSMYVSRDYAIQQGMVGYAKDPNKAKSNQRVAPNPLIVKGLRSDGPNRTDVVISNQDAAALHSMSDNLSFLRKCKVMILVD